MDGDKIACQICLHSDIAKRTLGFTGAWWRKGNNRPIYVAHTSELG